MKIIIAMDSFKGSLSSMDVVNSVAQGIRKVLPEAELVTLPIADGGEGTVDTFLSAMGGRKYQFLFMILLVVLLLQPIVCCLMALQ